MVGRPFDEERDLAAVTRMWREVGWIDDSEGQAAALRTLLAQGEGLVADVHGEAECLVHRTRGALRYGRHTELALSVISAVTTSHVARRQGVASALVAAALDAAAAEGAAVASLGIFEQGFYDRFGFGTGAYEHRFAFDPATLQVPVPERPPHRLAADDAAGMYEALRRRHRGHGSVVLDAPEWMAVEWALVDKPFALGYRGPDGRITHFLMGSATADHGPYDVEWLVFEEPAQLIELLGVLRMLGDQVNRVTIKGEPAGVQLQDLVREPIRQRRAARLAGGSPALHQAAGVQQDRILDLPACIAAVQLRTPPIDLGLRLHDPLADRGASTSIAGAYTLRLGATSTVSDGIAAGLPVLEASVGALTRLWLGVRPATGLAISDDLAGDPALLERLDDAFRLPTPLAGWPY